MMLSGVPCIMSSATEREVQGLTQEEAAALQTRITHLDAAGRSLEHLVLTGPSGGQAPTLDLEALQSLSPELRRALAWRLRTPPAAHQAALHLMHALHCTSARRHRGNQQQTESFDVLLTAFALEHQAAQLNII